MWYPTEFIIRQGSKGFIVRVPSSPKIPKGKCEKQSISFLAGSVWASYLLNVSRPHPTALMDQNPSHPAVKAIHPELNDLS